jgi:hypothetical protein
VPRPRRRVARSIDSEKSRDIDQRRAARRVIEVVEAPCVVGQRILFDVRVTVQLHDRLLGQISGKHFADARRPLVIDETEVVVGIGAEAIDEVR